MGNEDTRPKRWVIAQARSILGAMHSDLDGDRTKAEHPLLYEWLEAYEGVWSACQDDQNRARGLAGLNRGAARRLPRLAAANRFAQGRDWMESVKVQADRAEVTVMLPNSQLEEHGVNLTPAMNSLTQVSERIVRPDVSAQPASAGASAQPAAPDISDRPTDRYPRVEQLEASMSHLGLSLTQPAPHRSPAPDFPNHVDLGSTGSELQSVLAARLITLLDTMSMLWGVTIKPGESPEKLSWLLAQIVEHVAMTREHGGDQNPKAPGGEHSIGPSSAFDTAVRQHLKLEIFELLKACCHLDLIDVVVGQPIDETRMVAVRGELSADSSKWGCVAEEVKWGYIDVSGAVYRRAEVAIFTRQS